MEVEYREHPDLPGYRVGNDGTVWSRWTEGRGSVMSGEWRQLKTRSGEYGHQHVGIKSRDRLAHRLVLEAFVGPCPDGMQCRHLDGNSRNNRLDNLAWGTIRENVLDRVKHCFARPDGRGPASKLTADQVRQIVSLSKTKSPKEIAPMFGIKVATISAILNGWSWQRVTGIVHPGYAPNRARALERLREQRKATS